jgi:hypothetical protein
MACRKRLYFLMVQREIPHSSRLFCFSPSTVPRTKQRRHSISPAPFLSGGWNGIREGGPVNRRAVVHRLGSLVSRSILCSPSLVDGVVRVCRGALLLCGLIFLAVPARQWWRCRRGIIVPAPSLAPLACYSGANGGTENMGISCIPCVTLRVL